MLKNKSVFFGLSVGLGVLLTYTYSAFDLYQMGVFDQENMILGGYPFMRSFAYAYGYGERSLIHPNLSNFVNPVVRVIAAVLSPVFPDLPMKAVQMRVALWVSPVCATLATTFAQEQRWTRECSLLGARRRVSAPVAARQHSCRARLRRPRAM